MDEERFDFLEAFAVPQSDGSWVHVLQAGRYGASPLPQGDAALLAGLHDLRHFIEVEDLSFSVFANRVPELPVQPHPWIDLILPYPSIDAFVTDVEQTLRPLVAGDRGSILLIPMRPQRFSKPLFRAPQAKFAFGFGILRSMPAIPTAVAQAVDFNRTLFDRCRDLGGTHYPISAVKLGRDDWALHYGSEFPRLVAAKARHDRRNVLAGGPDIF
jgi:cytokinin dehydrogenase